MPKVEKKTPSYRGYTIDFKQGEKVFPLAVEQRLALSYPYDKPSVQRQDNLDPSIEWGSLEHAIFLFLTCLYQKGGIDSEIAIKQLTRLRIARPYLFDSSYFLKFDTEGSIEFKDELVSILDRFGLGSNAQDAARCWVYNMQKLAQYWKGDPRLLFANVASRADETWKSLETASQVYEDLCQVIMRKPSMSHERLMDQPNGFYGFRHKMVSMLAYFFIDAGIIPRFAYPPPIDFHLIRFLVSTQIIRFDDLRPGSYLYTERLLPGARNVTLWYVVKTGTPSEIFAEAMWVLSRELCKRSPGNKCTVDKIHKARAREIYEHPVTWTPGQQRRYEKTCGMCPIEKECKWNIQSAYYYVKGYVRLSRKRSRSPQLPLLNLRKVPLVKVVRDINPASKELPVLYLNQLPIFE